MTPSSAQTPTQTPTYTFDMLCAVVLGNATLAERVAGEFLRLKPQQQARLAQALAQNNLQALSEAAHEVRGMALTMGATGLAQAATALELRADEGCAEGLTQLHEQLLGQWQAVELALQVR